RYDGYDDLPSLQLRVRTLVHGDSGLHCLVSVPWLRSRDRIRPPHQRRSRARPRRARGGQVTDRFPFKDRDGYPLGLDCFVDVEIESSSGMKTRYSGLVIASEPPDEKGPMLVIEQWKKGKPTGRPRPCRPEHCRVKTRTKAVREKQEEDDRIA